MPHKISQRKIRVAIVDDDQDMHLLIRDTLCATDDFQYAGGFSNPATALAELPSLSPDAVLLSIRKPGIHGIECMRQLKQILPAAKIIIVTGAQEPRLVDDAFRAGADGCLIEPITPQQWLAALKFAAGWRKIRRAPKHLRDAASIPFTEFTQREREVMSLLARGLLYKEIADELGTSYSAVHKHQHKIFKKLRVNNRSEAIRKWFQAGGDD